MEVRLPRSQFSKFHIVVGERAENWNAMTMVWPLARQIGDSGTHHFFVLFDIILILFYSAWIVEELIWPYVENCDKYKSGQRPSKAFQYAVETAEEVLQNMQSDKVSLVIV